MSKPYLVVYRDSRNNIRSKSVKKETLNKLRNDTKRKVIAVYDKKQKY